MRKKPFNVSIFRDTNDIYNLDYKYPDSNQDRVLLKEIFENISMGPTVIHIIKCNIYHQGINDYELSTRYFLVTINKSVS